MRISELVENLLKRKEQSGDLEVRIYDNDNEQGEVDNLPIDELCLMQWAENYSHKNNDDSTYLLLLG